MKDSPAIATAWGPFTLGAAVTSGLLTGAPSALYIVSNGRVAGNAGMLLHHWRQGSR